MKRKITPTLTTLAIILSLYVNILSTHANPHNKPPLFTSSSREPNTIWVPDNYATIQGAINNALLGDKIFVRTGTYRENLFVDKALSLIGEDRNRTIIDGGGDGTSIYIMATNVTITNFTIQNAQNGIWLRRSEHTILTNNAFLNNEYAIHVRESSGNILTNNTVSNNEYGIYLYSSSQNVLTANKASNNTYGIYVWGSSGNILSSNTASLNNYGTLLEYAGSNILTNNTVSNNEYGIYLYSSSQNVLTANKASNNQDGIHIRGDSRNNMIFHNNFINNTEPPSSINLENSWDNGAEGNYWSNYHGTDTNLDGIGDTPYYVDQNRKDSCPLMAPFQHFTLTAENYSHKINVICNSTISNLQYDYDLDTKTNVICLKAADTKNESFCRITIPHALVEPPYTIAIGDDSPSYLRTLYTNKTHTGLYFAYKDADQEIIIKHMPYPQQLLLSQWAIFGLTIIISVLLLATVNYYRKFNAQKKIIQAYEQELGNFPTSHPERARIRFIEDVVQRKERIEKFKKKYGVKIQPATTLESLMEKLDIQKKKKVKR